MEKFIHMKKYFVGQLLELDVQQMGVALHFLWLSGFLLAPKCNYWQNEVLNLVNLVSSENFV